MKKLIYLAIIAFGMTSCYTRIGDLTMASNRNVDPNAQYELLARNVESKIKVKKGDPLGNALDRATDQVNGEYMMNVEIWVRRNGKKVKISGDVYGIRPDTLIVQ